MAGGMSPRGVSHATALRARARGRLDGRCPGRHGDSSAALREAGQLEVRRRRAEAPLALPDVPPDQEATFAELMLAAEWTRETPGGFVDAEGAAAVLGCTRQQVGLLAASGHLPWLPTGHAGGGRPTRVYRRAQVEIIARLIGPALTAHPSGRPNWATP